MKNTLILLLFLMASFGAQAQNDASDINYEYFARIPIQHEGRVKPLDSFARILLERISGSPTLDGMPAIEWLARSIFVPEFADTAPIFQIKTADMQDRLGLDGTDISASTRYSYQDIHEGIESTFDTARTLASKDLATLTKEQKDFLWLHENVIVFKYLKNSLSFLLGETPPNAANYLFSVIKVDDTPQSQSRFISPSQAAYFYEGEEKLILWAKAGKAYRDLDIKNFTLYTKTLANIDKTNVKTELLYTQYKPLFWANSFYGLALFFVALWAVTRKNMFYRPAFLCAAIGIGLHIIGIAMRIAVLGRPPVTDLYESMLFVGLICAVGGIVFEHKTRHRALGFVTGILPAFLIMLASDFLALGGETKKVLGAVLNTNFWLGTHVVAITIGYGLCLLTGSLSHYYLWAGASEERPALLQKLLAGSFLFVTVGTILGGIWADQSWGRFWGWDPKENGALLIILWLTWASHGRISGHLKGASYFVSLAALNIIVALAWFGVNLLSTGLHSYGFTSGIGIGLGLFCTVEIMLIGWLYFIHKRKAAIL